jgi:hypothetical protein
MYINRSLLRSHHWAARVAGRADDLVLMLVLVVLLHQPDIRGSEVRAALALSGFCRRAPWC